ncbi:MAG TPA: DUF1566 domain-containing protein [Candidatus Limnocylindrales bacterium]|nr:DUF1566 domain-containing protein [Candidatus Limnocylindrales bacterium]
MKTRTVLGAWLLVAALASSAMAGEEPMCEPLQPCGDVNDSGTVTAQDALAVLRGSVGGNVDLMCSCGEFICIEGSILKTGQFTCYDPLDNVNPINTIACNGSGQDGQFLAGLEFSFIDNGDGTITDVNTNLMWEKLSDDGTIHDYQDFAYQWAGAYGKINSLNAMDQGAGFAGYNDWRLPNVREMASLVDFSTSSPSISVAFNNDNCAPGCMVENCSCTHSKPYWTSTTSSSSPNQAWTVNYATGGIASSSKTVYNYVRAVRGGR